MRSSIKANISFNNIYTRAGKGLDTPTCVLFNQVIETNKLHKWKLTKNTQNYLAFICISAKFCTQLCPRLKLWKTTVYNYITYYLFHLTGQLWSPPRERQKSLLLKHVMLCSPKIGVDQKLLQIVKWYHSEASTMDGSSIIRSWARTLSFSVVGAKLMMKRRWVGLTGRLDQLHLLPPVVSMVAV